jgi:DNA-binding response OmpR family regulator
VARDPEEALEAARTHEGEIDLLLSDVVMPGMNGKQLETQLRERQPDFRTLFMSGYTANVIARRGVLEEGVQFIQKPFTMSTLAHRVREVLDLREADLR